MTTCNSTSILPTRRLAAAQAGVRANGRLAGALLAIALAGSLVAAPAAEVSGTAKVATTGQALLSETDLDARIADLEKLQDGDATGKQELHQLRQARLALQKTRDSEARTSQYLAAIEQAPGELHRIQQQLTTPLPEGAPTPPQGADMDVLAQALTAARAELDSAQHARTELQAEEQQRVSRSQQIPGEQSEARKRLEQLRAEQAAPAPADQPGAVSAARRLALESELAYQLQLLKELDAELRSYDARQELLRVRGQLAERNVLLAQRQTEALDAQLNALRARQAAEAQRSAEAAWDASGTSHPVLRAIAQQNAAMAEELATISTKGQRLVALKQAADEKLQALQKSLTSIKGRIDQIGLTDAIGLHLRGQLQQLPDPAKLARRLAKRETEMNAVQLRRIELDDALLRLVDLRGEAQARLAAVATPLPPADESAIEDTVMQALAEQKRDFLDTLVSAYDLYFSTSLMPLHESEQRLLEVVREYDAFIAERILWIQSGQPLLSGDPSHAVAALSWLLAPQNWMQAGQQLAHGVAAQALPASGFALLLAALLWSLPRMRRKLRSLGETAHTPQARLGNTLAATGLTLLIAAPLPLLLWSLAMLLPQNSDASFAAALAAGLNRVAVLLYGAEVWRIICRRDGLGEAHFHWSRVNLDLIRHQLHWFVPTVLPLAFVIAALEAQPLGAYRESLGRMAFIAAMIAEAVFLRQLFLPSRGILSQWLLRHDAGWLARLRYLWYPALVASPLALAVTAALGYFYTALQLEQRLLETVWLLLGVFVLHALLLRWLRLEQRHLGIEQQRKKLAAQAKEQAATQTSAAADGKPSADADDLDLQVISTQAIKFLNMLVAFAIALGLFLVWQDVFPALGMLRQVELWTVVIPGVAEAGAEAVSQALPITLADISTALLILVVTGVVSSNIPGLLEMAVLQHLPFSPSTRYAFTTIVRYVIVIVGVVWAFSAIGIGWSKVQFLAAAITVGLGFGLQEIFANFVSGLIMLFERQVRVGDAVTIGNTSGIVSRIRMRATTITDWNLKELIIPNKEFVTGQVINWSLSDPKLRLDIPVGIAYGSDTELAGRTLMALAENHPLVLKDPPPRALFLGFGDSTLNFELRVYIPSYEHLIPVRHELLTTIDQAFREAGIEIAFPQRDIHIRSVDAGVNALLGGQRPPTA